MRFVENDKGILQGSSPHECQRGDFHRAVFQVFIEFIRRNHVPESVIQGAQIRVHFLLHVTGQKTQSLASLHRRPCKHDPFHPLFIQSIDCRSHRQVGLPGARRADPHHNVIFPDHPQVLALSRAPGLDHLFPVCHVDMGCLENLAAVGFSIPHRTRDLPDLACLKSPACLNHSDQAPERSFHVEHSRLLADNHHLPGADISLTVEHGFKKPEVLIIGPEKGQHVNPLDRNLSRDLTSVRGLHHSRFLTSGKLRIKSCRLLYEQPVSSLSNLKTSRQKAR